MKQKILSLGEIIYYFFLIFAAAIFLVPMLWMFSTSLKAASNVYAMPPQWIPNPINWNNFSNVFIRMPFLSYFKNSLIVAVLPVIGQLMSVPLVTYSITKVDWKGAKIIFPLVMITMMIPWQVTQIPMFATWSKLGFVNTFVPLVLPAFFGSPYYIYLMRQFMKNIPGSLTDAARIDGANDLNILFRIIMPMCRPILTTIALLVFVAAWNDLNGPLMYLQQSKKYTLAIGLQNFMCDNTMKHQFEILMAAVTLFSIPLIILFIIFQKQFISGIAAGGVKG